VKRNRLLLIDSNALIHRSYHALPPLTDRQGHLVNAVYGYLISLFKAIDQLKPEFVIATFDTKAPTFRHKEYKEYKAKRVKAPDELYEQIPLVEEALSILEIPIMKEPGFEADDVIGTLAKRATENPKSKIPNSKQTANNKLQTSKIDEVVIITGDRDIFQLINSKVKVYVPVKGLKEGKLYGVDEVKHEFDFEPIKIIDYKALVGDSSDNYPGVPGIGPKTAINLLTKYKTKENIYKHLEDIPESTRNKLEQGKDMADMSYDLATILTDVPVKIDFGKMDDWDLGSVDAVKLFMSYGFRTLLNRITNGNNNQETNEVKKTLKTNDDEKPETVKTSNSQESLF